MSQSVPEGARRRSLASVTKYIPHAGIAHAGGQYVHKHYAALSGELSIDEIAPDTPLNRRAVEQADSGASISLVTSEGVLKGGRLKVLGDIESAWAGSSVTWDVRRAFTTGRAPWELMRRADGVEFHWSEMLALAPSVRRELPSQRLVGIAHDVITQRWARAAEAASWPASVGYSLAARRSMPRERSSFLALDAVVVFSEKDARLVKEIAPGAATEVVFPGLGPDPGEVVARAPDGSEPIVLFTGALSRGDNHDAVVWFLTDIWPRILEAIPSARFVAAGASPRPALERLVARTARAELTGYVESLEPHYARASVFVAPLSTGAGVKFKTIDALLRSVPVVSTPVGAEGIEAQSGMLTIATTAGAFADAVVTAIREPDQRAVLAASAWAEEAYGASAFARRILEVYRRIGIIE